MLTKLKAGKKEKTCGQIKCIIYTRRHLEVLALLDRFYFYKFATVYVTNSTKHKWEIYNYSLITILFSYNYSLIMQCLIIGVFFENF